MYTVNILRWNYKFCTVRNLERSIRGQDVNKTLQPVIVIILPARALTLTVNLSRGYMCINSHVGIRNQSTGISGSKQKTVKCNYPWIKRG